MAEDWKISKGSLAEQYESCITQLRAMLATEDYLIARMANTAAALHTQFQWLWTGFYLVRNNMLVLGPFQGPIACMSIPFGKGVCGTSWKENKTLIVPDVNLFPGHIACSSLSRSEIVIPLHASDDPTQVVGVLDIDSQHVGSFDETDQYYLEQIASLVMENYHLDSLS